MYNKYNILKYNILKNNIEYNLMLYCLNCIDSIIPTTSVLKRQNAQINISTNVNFVCSHCKTNVIICNINNNVQTKDLKIDKLKNYNIKDDPVDDINDICFILKFLSYNI